MSRLSAADEANVIRIADSLLPEFLGIYSYEIVTRFVTDSPSSPKRHG